MRRSTRDRSKELESASANAANCREKPRLRGNGDIGARPIWFGLIASLVVAVPGFAVEFRSNPFSLGGSSKTADASAGVDGTSGAATLSIPIAVPPGPGGLAPTLNLNYSSDRGDGPFGVGWDLQLGEIRCTARFGVPDDYASCPDFELDGQLLVGPAAAGRYHTKVESFNRILRMGTAPSEYWEVTLPGGTRLLYGGTAESKIGSDGEYPTTAPTARWLLSKIIDIQGNEIEITYDRSDVGVAYPSTISYAAGEREVAFVYEDRPDTILDFPGGIPRNITKRLHEIWVNSAGGVFSRRRINYSPIGKYKTHRSRIDSTQLFGEGCSQPGSVVGCASLPAQTFEYTTTAAGPHWPSTPDPAWNVGFWVTHYPVLGDGYDWGKRIADINGDGLPDLVDGLCSLGGFPCNGQGPTVYINDGAGWVQNAAWTSAIGSLTYEVPTITPEIQAVPPEVLAICDATFGTLERSIVFSDELSDAWPVPGTTETYAARPGWKIVDINGDGLADLVSSVQIGYARRTDCSVSGSDLEVLHGNPARKVYLNNGVGWDEAPAMEQGLPVFSAFSLLLHYSDSLATWNEWQDGCRYSGWAGEDVCSTYMDLRPQFVELNGDGLLDLIVLEPETSEDLWLSFYYEHPVLTADGGTWGTGRATSKAWLQNADGTGWTPAPEFDLPGIAHVEFNHVPNTPESPNYGGMKVLDSGVHFVDLNRDGLTDIAHDSFDHPPQFSGGVPAGVLLNTGTGWCNDMGDAPEPAPMPCDADPNSRYDPPIRFHEWEYAETDGHDSWPVPDPKSTSNKLVFVDLNGDGWMDLLQGMGDTFDPEENPLTLTAWLHDPGGETSVWTPAPEFAPPVPIRPGTQFVDLDGNGAVDIIHGRTIVLAGTFDEEEAYLPPATHSDLLASVDNGRGGITDFTYVSSALQQGSAMETDAEAHAATIGDADGNSAAVTLFTTKPVVSERTVSGVGIAANVTTRYQYARPRFDPVEHSNLGFGLVETTNPDGASVDAYYYQREGLVGRLSTRETLDENDILLHRTTQEWVLAENPENIPGAMGCLPGTTDCVFVARLDNQDSRNVYGLDEFGPFKKDQFVYDDTHGYNFVSQVISTRATGPLTTTITPEPAYEPDWLVGLVAEQKETANGITYSREGYIYTQTGQLEHRYRYLGPRDGNEPSVSATTSWAYDGYGNVTSQTDTRGSDDETGTAHPPRVVEYCYDGDAASWCPQPSGGAPATHSLRVGVKDPIAGITQLEYNWTLGTLTRAERYVSEGGPHRDAIIVSRDEFGREIERSFIGASMSLNQGGDQLSTTLYHAYDDVNGIPEYVEKITRVSADTGETIRSAIYRDGFGNSMRSAKETPSGYVGTAVFRDPAARTLRTTGPIDCGSDDSCSGITETTEPFTEQLLDAAGRVVRTTTLDGQMTQDYLRIQRTQPVGYGTESWFDAVRITNANQNATQRLTGGGKVVWVDECDDSECLTYDSTFYTYEPTGELSAIYDAIAISSADYTSPERYLRYEYDTAGRVVRTDEPNTGPSYADYDHQGNIISATNVRGTTTRTYRDVLGRIVKIDRPVGVAEWDLTFAYDHPTSRRRTEVYNDEPSSTSSYYRDVWQYDDYGNVTQQIRTYANDTLVMDFTDHDLLGRPARIDYPSENSSASYAYDGAYLTKVCRGPDAADCAEKLWVSDVQYDGLGRRESTVTLEGTLTHEYYGIAPETGGFVNALKRVAITAGNRAGAVDDNYQYNALGQMTNVEDLQSFNSRDDSAIYTYGSRDRLESWEDADGIKKWYTYDELGNLTGHGVDSEGGTNQTFTTVDSTKPHQITLNRRNEDYEYDADGNVIRRGWWTHFVYDSANRLVCTGSDVGLCDGPAYRYDADGQLMYDGETQAILMGELFKWRPHWGDAAYSNLVAFGEVIGQARQDNATLREVADPSAWWLPVLKGPLLWLLAGAGGLGLLALLAWLGAGVAFNEHPASATLALALSVLLIAPPTAWGMGGSQPPPAPGDDQVSLFFRNHQGSLVFATNPGGRQAYEPFGKARYSRGGREFTNKQFHFASKMYYFGARWYDAEAGRFAGVDPLVTQPENPQQLNAYGYALNDPVNLMDPTGMCVRPGIGGIGCGIGTAYGSTYRATVAAGTVDPTNNQGGYEIASRLGSGKGRTISGDVANASEAGAIVDTGDTVYTGSTWTSDHMEIAGFSGSWSGGSSSSGGIQIAGGPAAAQAAVRLQRAIDRAMGAVVSEINAVNERGGLLYNRDRVNKDIGSVVRPDGSGGFENSKPDTAAPWGLEQIEGGFAGGLQPITNASALVVGLPLGGESALTSQRAQARFEGLSRQIGGPVIVRAMGAGNTTYRFSSITTPVRVK